MKKIRSFRQGRIWLNVLGGSDGSLALTIVKSYPSSQGWKTTDFLRPEDTDLMDLMQCLTEFMEAKNELAWAAAEMEPEPTIDFVSDPVDSAREETIRIPDHFDIDRIPTLGDYIEAEVGRRMAAKAVT